MNSPKEIAEAWHLFEIRRALLTSEYLCFSAQGMIHSEIRTPEITSATSSLLYVNAVSLFDEATESQMGSADFEKCGKLGNRLPWLNARGKLLDFDRLDKIRERRNEVAHELDKQASIKELEETCSVLRSQLLAWDLIKAGPPYTLYYERSAARHTEEPGAFEQDRILRVMRDTELVCELKQTARLGGE